MASIFSNSVVDMAVVGACKVYKIFHTFSLVKSKAEKYGIWRKLLVQSDRLGESLLTDEPVVSLVSRSLTLLSIPSPCGGKGE